MENPSKAPWADLVLSIEQGKIPTHGRQRLKLRATPKNVEDRVQPTRLRSMAMVDKRVQEVFHRLVTGQALWPLYLYGPEGSAKTYAALCLCDYVHRAVFRTAEEIGREVYNPDAYLWTLARERSLFVIDELGVGNPSEDKWLREYQAVKRVTDYREECGNRVAIYISNLNPKHLARVYDKRVYDRITCGEIFDLDGPSRRRGG